MIDVKNLTSYYTKGIDVIEDINFKIDDSGVLVILGKNGSGKSTILKYWLSYNLTNLFVEWDWSDWFIF